MRKSFYQYVNAEQQQIGDVTVGCSPAVTAPAVTLKNNGTKPITVTPKVSGTDFSLVSADPITIDPNGTALLSGIVLTPTDLGTHTGSVDLVDANGNTVLRIPLSANVVPSLS